MLPRSSQDRSAQGNGVAAGWRGLRHSVARARFATLMLHCTKIVDRSDRPAHIRGMLHCSMTDKCLGEGRSAARVAYFWSPSMTTAKSRAGSSKVLEAVETPAVDTTAVETNIEIVRTTVADTVKTTQ